MTPLAPASVISFACSGLEIPKPTKMGMIGHIGWLYCHHVSPKHSCG